MSLYPSINCMPSLTTREPHKDDASVERADRGLLPAMGNRHAAPRPPRHDSVQQTAHRVSTHRGLRLGASRRLPRSRRLQDAGINISDRNSRMLAEKVLGHDATPASGTWVLFPNSGGNMHRFVAGENDHCAFLDVLTPPYAATGRRRCAYYQDFSYEPCPCKH